MEYKVLAAMRDDLNQGWVWVTKPGLDPRSVVKITNKNNGKSVYCESLEIDDNYLSTYNKAPRETIDHKVPTMTINSWYRRKLGGIATKANHELEVKSANGWYGKIRANLQHPQVVIRMGTWLAFISVLLGLLSLGLAVFGVCLTIK